MPYEIPPVHPKQLEGDDNPEVTPNLIQFFGEGGELLVSITPDCTVTIHKEGGEKEASDIFWTQLQTSGRTLVQKVKDLINACNILKEEHQKTYQRGFEEGRKHEREVKYGCREASTDEEGVGQG